MELEDDQAHPGFQRFTVETEVETNEHPQYEDEKTGPLLTSTIENEDIRTNLHKEAHSDLTSDQQLLLGSDFKLYHLEDGRMFIEVETVKSPKCTEEPSINPVKLILYHEDDIVEENEDDPLQINYEVEPESEKEQKEFKCLYSGCHESFTTFHESTVHMKTHTVEVRPYVCTIEGCDKRFATNYSRKTHIRTHTGEKPYACTECEKSFKTSGDLHKHSRVHSGEKPFLCPLPGCGKSFRTSNIRKVHLRSHTGERPYVCDYPNCGKAFSSLTNFKNHSRIHSGERPFACSVSGCNKRFTEYSSLYKHSVVHQVDRPYQCSFCQLTFKSESALNLHKRVKHNVIITQDGVEIVVNIDH